MNPILSDTFPVVGNGLGGLPDAIECVVSHEINGEYELQMRYPITGQHFDEIENGRFIMAKPDDLTPAQPFRVYRITKPLNGVVTVYARHICYDMQGIIVEPFSAGSLTEAFQTIPTVLTPANSFSFQTTRTVASGMEIKEPRPLWKLIGGQAGSILDVYGGEWDFDGYTAKLVTQLGTNRGVTIRYGKNMTSLEQDATIEAAYSGVYPFWYDEDSGALVTLPEKFVAVPGAVVTDRLLNLDCSDDFDTQPTEQELRDRATAYINANSVGNVKASWKVSFVSSTGYEDDLRLLEQVMLGDTLGVHYERMGVDATARAVKTEYDVLADRYKAVTIGKVKQNLAQILVEQQERTESQFAGVRSDIEHAVDNATDFIKHGEGYMRFIYNASDELTEIVSLDDPDITQALSVWRWNNGGFGHSSTGYNGPYTLAITQNGAIVADFITSGTLNANIIRAGILQDAQGYNSWNLQTGAFSITNGSINITTQSSTFDAITLNYGAQSVQINPSMSHYVGPTEAAWWSDMGFYIDSVIGNGSLSNLQKSGLFLYTEDANGKYERAQFWNDGQLHLIDANGNARLSAYSSTGGIWLKKAADANTSVFILDTDDKTRTRLSSDALTFFDANGAQSAVYPADPSTFLKDNDITASMLEGSGYNVYSSTGTTTVSLTNDKTYLVTLTRRNSTDQSYNAMWLVSAGTSNSSVTTIKSGTGSSASVNGLTLSITRGTAYSRVTWLRLN